ncbi:MAG: hypothetical protein HY904_05405 [Deltaproteobacteria bacterium]|nr:hypothetical protein [Deltaproteobacteria bacterium]
MSRHAGRWAALVSWSVLTGCIYLPDKLPIELGEGDVTAVVFGVPPHEVGSRNLKGARVRVRGSAVIRTTHDDGRFVVRNLPEGEHVLQVSWDPDRDGVPDLGRVLSVKIRIPAGRTKRSGIDLGSVELLRPGTITGRVENTVAGPVPPYADVAVNLFQSNPLNGAFELSEHRAFPDPATGAFRFEGVGAGEWEVQAARMGQGSQRLRATVEEAQATELPAPLLLNSQVDDGHLGGTLLEPPGPTQTSGLGVVQQGLFEGLVITLVPALGGAPVVLTPGNGRIITGDSGGELRFDTSGLPPGVYDVTIELGDDYLPLRFSFVVVAGQVVELGRLLVSRAGGVDMDGDGFPYAGTAHCVTECLRAGRDPNVPCDEGGTRWDCDDDLDGQVDADELGAGSFPACHCGPAGEVPDSPTCDQDPLRFDLDHDRVCDLSDRFPGCTANRDPCELPDAGVPDAGHDAGPVDAGVDAGFDAGFDAGPPPDAAVGPFGLTQTALLVERPAAGADAGGHAGTVTSAWGATVAADGYVVALGQDDGMSFPGSACAPVGPSQGTLMGGVVVVRVGVNGRCRWRSVVDVVQPQARVDVTGVSAGGGWVHVGFQSDAPLRINGVPDAAPGGTVLLAFPDANGLTPRQAALPVPSTAYAAGPLPNVVTDPVTGRVALVRQLQDFELGTESGELRVFAPDLTAELVGLSVVASVGNFATTLSLSGPAQDGPVVPVSYTGQPNLGAGDAGVPDAGFPAAPDGGVALWGTDWSGGPPRVTTLPLGVVPSSGVSPPWLDLHVVAQAPGTLMAGQVWDGVLLAPGGVTASSPLAEPVTWVLSLDAAGASVFGVDVLGEADTRFSGGRLSPPVLLPLSLGLPGGAVALAGGGERIVRLRRTMPGASSPRVEEYFVRGSVAQRGMSPGLVVRLDAQGAVRGVARVTPSGSGARVGLETLHRTADGGLVVGLAVRGGAHLARLDCNGVELASEVEDVTAPSGNGFVLWHLPPPALPACAWGPGVNTEVGDDPPTPDGTVAMDIPAQYQVSVGPGFDEDCMTFRSTAAGAAHVRVTDGTACTGDVVVEAQRTTGVVDVPTGADLCPHARVRVAAADVLGVCVRGQAGLPVGPVDVQVDLVPPPGNNDCTAAQGLPLLSPASRTAAFSGDTASASAELDLCGPGYGADVYYAVQVAGSGVVRARMTGTPGSSVRVALTSDGCTSRTVQGCAPLTTTGTPWMNVEATALHRMAVMDNDPLRGGPFQGELEYVEAGAHTTCATAEMITPPAVGAPVRVRANIARSAQSWPIQVTNCTQPPPEARDSWHRFVAPSTGVIRATPVTPFNGTLYVVELTRNDCTTLMERACTAAADGRALPVRATAEYALVVQAFDAQADPLIDVDLAFEAGATNVDCPTAMDLGTLSSAGSPFLLAGTTAGGGADMITGCTAPADAPDVVYRFTAGTSGAVRVLDDPANALPGNVAIMEEGACANILQRSCDPLGPYAAGPVSVVPGNGYLVVVQGAAYQDQGPFRVQLEYIDAVPANDRCALAVDLGSLGGATRSVSFSGSTILASGDWGSTACRTTAGRDVHYRLNVTDVSLPLTIRLDQMDDNPLLFWGVGSTACGSEVGCGALGTNPSTVVLPTAGTYWLAVHSQPATAGLTFHGTASLQAPTPSDACSAAPDLLLAPSPVTGTLDGFVNDLSASDYGVCTGYSSMGPDGFYRFALQPAQTLDVSFTFAESGNDASLWVLDACPTLSAPSCVAGSDRAPVETVTVTNSGTAVQTYVLVLDSYSVNAALGFTLTWALR